ncbi:MAG TPA: OmpA family protein [Polyangiaceae bacterium]|nr:OmpA family protein [Polyangiaceae bacterium]
MMRRKALVALAALGAIAMGEGTARAANPLLGNDDGLDTHLFRPAMDSKGFFATNGSDILGHLDFSVGLVVDYGRTILRTDGNFNPGGRTNSLIDNSFQGTLQANLGLFNQIVVGLDLPIVLMDGAPQYINTSCPNGTQGCANPSAGPYQAGVPGWGSAPTPGAPATALNSQNLEFLALHAKWRILRVERGFGLALALQGGVAVTDAYRQAAGDRSFFVWPQLIADKHFGATGKFKLGANVGFRAHNASATHLTDIRNSISFDKTPQTGDLYDGQLLTYGLAASYRAGDAVDLVLDTYGTYQVGTNTASNIALSNEVTAGIKLFVDRNSYFMLGGGTRYTAGFEAADFRGFVGFIYEPSIGDRDGDGYKDDVDQCPDEPEDFDGFKDEDGCPDPDNDNDGILDVDDRCPNEPEDRDGDHDEDGCPEGNDGDRDGDGILDSKDKCPDQPEDRDGFQDSDGCPDPDNDMDGIPDKQDACPNDPEDKDGFQDQDGCPDPDNDQDGIPDAKDKCPGSDADVKANKDTKETYNGFEDDDGCPDKGNVIIQGNDILILQKIKFKTNSAEILPESNPILDAVSTTLLHHPEFTLVEVAGHADERAPDAYNLRLTQDRVDSVVAAMLSRGVERSRLRSKGYGEYCPANPAHNDKAWEENRRVEFKVVKTRDSGPTGVELGCQNARAHGVNPDPVPQ